MTYLDTGNIGYRVEGARSSIERYPQVSGAALPGLSGTGVRNQDRYGRRQEWLHASGAVRGAEDEVDGANQTECGPEVIQPERLPHVHDCKGNEHDQRDHLLQYLELSQGESGLANPVRGNL